MTSKRGLKHGKECVGMWPGTNLLQQRNYDGSRAELPRQQASSCQSMVRSCISQKAQSVSASLVQHFPGRFFVSGLLESSQQSS